MLNENFPPFQTKASDWIGKAWSFLIHLVIGFMFILVLFCCFWWLSLSLPCCNTLSFFSLSSWPDHLSGWTSVARWRVIHFSWLVHSAGELVHTPTPCMVTLAPGFDLTTFRVFVVVLLWWCFCGGAFVVVFLWWCFCGGVFVVATVTSLCQTCGASTCGH